MMKILSFTATSVAMVALQGCKSTTDMSKLTKTAKDSNAKITGDNQKLADFDKPITTFEKDVKKVKEQSKDLKESTKKEWTDLKVKDVCTNLTAMNTQFLKALPAADAKTLFARYTKAVAGQWKFFDYSTTCTTSPGPSKPSVEKLQAQAAEVKSLLVQQQKEELKKAKDEDKDAIKAKFAALIKALDEAGDDVAKLEAAIKNGKAAVPKADLILAKDAANKRIAELKKINTKEAKDAIAAIKAAMNKKGATADEINKAVDAAKNIKPVPDADSAAMDKAYKAFVADLPTDEDKALETERVKDMSDDEKLAEYKQMKADFKTANPTKDFTEEEAVKAYKNTFDVYKTLQGEIKAANTDFDQDMTTYAEGADPKLTAELVKALKDQWKDASMTDALKVAQHKMFKSIKEGDKTENVPQFPSDDKTIVAKVATAAGDARDTEIRTNVVTVYKAIADRLIQDQQVKAAEEQHTKDMALTGADSVGLNQAQVDDETFRWGTVSKTDKIAQMGVINGKANAVEKKTEYERLMTEAKATLTTAYATDVDDGITAAVDAVAPHADIRTQAKALFDALTLEQMTVQATELKSAIGDKTDAAKIAEQKKFVFGKLSEAADAQHTKDVDAAPPVITIAGLLDNEKYRWTSIVDAMAADAKADNKVKFYVDRKAVTAPMTPDQFYENLVTAQLHAETAAFNVIRDTDAVCVLADRPFANEYWASLETLKAKHEFIAELNGKANDGDRKTTVTEKLGPFKNLNARYTHFVGTLGGGDVAIEDERWTGIGDIAAKLAAFNTMVGAADGKQDVVTDPLFQAAFDAYKILPANLAAHKTEFDDLVDLMEEADTLYAGADLQAQSGADSVENGLVDYKAAVKAGYVAGHVMDADQKWATHFAIAPTVAIAARKTIIADLYAPMEFNRQINLALDQPIATMVAVCTGGDVATATAAFDGGDNAQRRVTMDGLLKVEQNLAGFNIFRCDGVDAGAVPAASAAGADDSNERKIAVRARLEQVWHLAFNY